MATKTKQRPKAKPAAGKASQASPVGSSASAHRRELAARGGEYAEARTEYDAIRELRKRNWIAAHVRERRFELELTQKQVAEAAGTSDTYICKLERGEHIPTIPVLKRVLAVLDEELLIGIQPSDHEDESEREIALVPELVG